MIGLRFIVAIIIGLGIYSCGNSESANESFDEEASEKDTVATKHTDTVITSQPKKLLSPRKIARANTVFGEIEVDYGAPSVRGRKIWGELVPYDSLWRAGANETTAITFENNVSIGDKILQAGTYGFFVYPRDSGKWTVVLNTKWHKDKHDMWGTYGYNSEHDVVRLDVLPRKNDFAQETLQYKITNDVSIQLVWDSLLVEVPVTQAE